MERAHFTLIVSVLALAACSSSSDGTSNTQGGGAGDVTRICQRFVACGVTDSNGTPYTQGTCELEQKGWLPLSGCTAAIQTASCGDLAAPKPPEALRSACYPDCATTTCSDDQSAISLCVSIGAVTFSCSSLCERNGEKYSGICGTSANGQTSPTPKCWCK